MYNSSPIVSVLMPAYNAQNFIAEAIESILNQTYKNFEFIIVDDGSTDATVEIIKRYKDRRISLIKLPENKGNRYAANFAIKEAKGKYLVRQDADDISLPTRIEDQVMFMEEHPDIGFSGGSIEYFGDERGVVNYPTSSLAVQAAFIFGPGVSQPASIVRNQVIIDNNIYYKEDGASFAEDYQFFFGLSKVSKGANISKLLIKYRRHKRNISSLIGGKNKHLSNKILSDVISYYFFSPTEEELYYHNKLRGRDKSPLKKNEIRHIYNWVQKLVNNNTDLDQNSLKKLLDEKWGKLFFITLKSGFTSILTYIVCSKKIKRSQLFFVLKHYLKIK